MIIHTGRRELGHEHTESSRQDISQNVSTVLVDVIKVFHCMQKNKHLIICVLQKKESHTGLEWHKLSNDEKCFIF